MAALAKVLYGEIAPAGKLPVAIPAARRIPSQTLHPFGHGLTFDPRQTRLTVASYNIHAGAGEDNVFDLDRTAQALKALDADVIGLQEVDVHWDARSQWRDTIAELAAKLGMYAGFAPIYDLDPPAAGQPRRQYGVGVLSRFPLVRTENHPITRLSTQDPNPVPASRRDSSRPRSTSAAAGCTCTARTWTTARTRRSGRSRSATRRRSWPRTARKDLQILVGDFNAEPGRARSSPGCGPGSPMPGPWPGPPPAVRTRIRRSTPVKRIDVVAVGTGLRVRQAAVPAELAASDHRPVVADLSFHP